MELIKKNIHFNSIEKEAGNQITIEEDINIPDTGEDVESLLFSSHRIILEEVKAGDGKVHIRGKMIYSILYKSEESGRLCALEGSILIDEQLYMEGLTAGDKVQVKTKTEDFSTGVINSRKISIQAILDLYARVQKLYDREITTQIEDKDCQIKQKECNFTQLAVCKKDIYRLKESVSLPNNMPNIENIVFSKIQLSDIEYKPLDGQISIQGKAGLFVIYDGERDSKNQIFEAVFPFGAMLECMESNMNMIPEICYDIAESQVQAETDFDGEGRNFSVELVMELDIKMYEPQKVSLLWDVYGIGKEITPVVENMEYDILTEHLKGNIKLSEKIKLPDAENTQAKMVYQEGESILEECSVNPEGILLKGIVICKLLYLVPPMGEEYKSTQCILPFEKTIKYPENMNASEHYDCRSHADLWQLQCIADMNGGVEIKAVVSYDMLVFETVEGRNIKDVKVDEIDMEKYNQLPSMAVCFAKSGDTLWNMGKKYRVPVKQIMEMNHISGDEVKTGEGILIVRGMEN